jgi:hypothetical protein
MSGNICVRNPFDGALDPWTCAWLNAAVHGPPRCGKDGIDFPARADGKCYSEDRP